MRMERKKMNEITQPSHQFKILATNTPMSRSNTDTFYLS